jgi:hypothetical protein
MAAIDRVIHHSVILDMMEVESYRASEANKHRKLQQETAQKPVNPTIKLVEEYNYSGGFRFSLFSARLA